MDYNKDTPEIVLAGQVVLRWIHMEDGFKRQTSGSDTHVVARGQLKSITKQKQVKMSKGLPQKEKYLQKIKQVIVTKTV